MDREPTARARAVSTTDDAWFARKEVEGKTSALWELEVWLRALERFFRIKNLPLSQPHLHTVLEKSFADELVIVGEALRRARELANGVMGEDRVSLLKFTRYVEESLVRDDERGSYLRMAPPPDTPEWRLAILIENLGALLQIQGQLARLGSMSYFGYKAFGRMVVELVAGADLFGPLGSNPFRPGVDRVASPRAGAVVRGIPDRFVRQEVARLVLALFRFLRYLDLVRNEFVRDGASKRPLMLFTLIHAEAELLLRFMKGVVLTRLGTHGPAAEILDAWAFGTGMELKKVFQKELVDFAGLTEREVIYGRMENAHGILKEAFQQGIVSVLQHFDPTLEGNDMFPNFVTKRELSRRLLMDLHGLHGLVTSVGDGADFEALFRIVRRIENFQQSSLKALMYKDWNDFETFQGEFKACRNLKNFQFVRHRFATYLATLVDEVKKRVVLRGEDIAAVLGAGSPTPGT